MGFEVPNLAYLRNIPIIGGRLYEALHGAQQAINIMAAQGNLNPSGQVQPPPAIQSVSAIGENGMLNVSIEHTAADVSRGVVYHVEHADNPGFVNPQIRQLGDARTHSEWIGSQTRYVRAYASYPGSPAGPVLYHGGASTPQPVNGGGPIGPAPYLPSQGRSTGAAGQGGADSSPVPIRSNVSGFDWRKQRPIATSGIASNPSQGVSAGGASAGSGGGGGGIVTQPEIFGTHADRIALDPNQYPTNTFFYETDRMVTYWVQPAVGVVNVTGGLNVAWVSGTKFSLSWPTGSIITINGNPCTIALVNSTTSISLALSIANGTNLSYSFPRGAWRYFSGRMENQWSALPSDLGVDDATKVGSVVISGFLFYDSKDSGHEWQWDGANWGWGPDNILPSGVIIPGSSVPFGYHLADGSTVNVYSAAATRASVTIPDAREFYLKLSATYTGVGNPAIAPTILGQPLSTGTAGTGDSVSTGSQNVQSGTGASVVNSVSFIPAPGGHSHPIPTLTNDTDGVPATFALLPCYRI